MKILHWNKDFVNYKMGTKRDGGSPNLISWTKALDPLIDPQESFQRAEKQTVESASNKALACM